MRGGLPDSIVHGDAAIGRDGIDVDGCGSRPGAAGQPVDRQGAAVGADGVGIAPGASRRAKSMPPQPLQPSMPGRGGVDGAAHPIDIGPK